MKAYQFASGNPLMGQVAQGYVLVPTILGGAHEWMAHLTQLILAWIAVIAMTSLVIRFGRDRWHAMAGSLLLVAIPPFLPMASTAMPDMLATALTLIAIERLAVWKAERKWNQAIAAAIALGLAGFARPHLVLLFPLAALFLLENINPKEIPGQIRRKFWLWTPVIVGCGVLSVTIFALREHNLVISPPSVMVGRQYILSNLCAYLLYFAFPLPLAACWLVNRLKATRLHFVIILSALAVTPLLLYWETLLMLLLVVLGFGVLADLSWQVLKRRELTDLFLVLWVLIPLPIVYYSHLPIKYLLPCMPAVILLCFRLLNGLSVRFAQAAALVLIIAGTGYSVLILNSDADFANFGRDALYRVIGPYSAAGERVWYPGQYWSYWYAPLAGATLTFPGGPQPKPGDLLVVDVYAAQDTSPLKRFPHRTLVETVYHKYRFGRTMGAGKCLYSNWWGCWLWGFGESDKDRFELWRID
jgi:4-amino-4-deoxy-L-arabinose transferase-like glycosyltransferase